HLLQLPANDRRLRFGRALRDEGIRDYVAAIDFERDRVFGIHDPAPDLAGVAHLAPDPADKAAELGLSANADCRQKGYGFALLGRAQLHAANLGYRTLFMHCLAENGTMMRLARKAGLLVLIEAGEADGRLRLDRRTPGSALAEAIADQMALVDILIKQTRAA